MILYIAGLKVVFTASSLGQQSDPYQALQNEAGRVPMLNVRKMYRYNYHRGQPLPWKITNRLEAVDALRKIVRITIVYRFKMCNVPNLNIRGFFAERGFPYLDEENEHGEYIVELEDGTIPKYKNNVNISALSLIRSLSSCGVDLADFRGDTHRSMGETSMKERLLKLLEILDEMYEELSQSPIGTEPVQLRDEFVGY